MVQENIQTAKVICGGGLDSNQNYLELSETSPGGATQLVNFEPSMFGGYRRLDGYTPLHTNFNAVDPTNAEGPILTVALYGNKVIAARKQKSGNTYRFYITDLVTNWVASGPTRSSVGLSRVRWSKFTFGVQERIEFVDGVNKPIVYDGTSWTELNASTTSPSPTTPGGDQLVPTTSKITVFKRTVFTAGDLAYPNLVNYSAPEKYYDYTAAAGGGQIVCSFPVVQIKPFRDELFVFGTNNINKIVLDSQGNFVLQDVAQNIGCIAPDSVAEVGGDLIFLSQDGIRNISGTTNIGDVNLASISKKIQGRVREFIQAHTLRNVQTIVVQSKSQIRMFFSDSDNTQQNAQGIIGGLVNSDAGVTWEWGELLGIRSSFAYSSYIDNEEYVLHGDYDGVIYRQETGDSFNGNPIAATYQTPFLDFGDSQVRKTMRTLNIFMRPEGAINLMAAFKFDWGLDTVQNPQGYAMTGGKVGAVYGQAIYAVSKYGGISVPVSIKHVEGSCFSVQLTFNTLEVAPSYSIQGIVYEFTPNGRT